MKFLIIGDLHGNKPQIHFKDFDAVIAPGDFCSDALRKHMFEAVKQSLDQKKTVWWYDLIGHEKAKEYAEQSISDGKKILEFLDSIGKPVYAVPGNWDWTAAKDGTWDFLKTDHYSQMLKGLKNVVDVHHKLVDAGEFQFIGHGVISGPEYPQYDDVKMYTEKELKEKKESYEKTKNKLAGLFAKAKKPVIFMPHNVPFNTPIDMITNKESPRFGQHFGSLIARELVDKYQPLVCVGGHMHEHFTKCMLGKTTCINAGFGSFVNVLLEVEGDKIKRLEFWNGKAS